jgi:uncharacterized membrane protein YoaK (UPF0700 family)
MEALYTLGLEIHTVSVLVLMGVVMFNILMLSFAKHLVGYARRMRIVMPISISFIALILFTGAIMMAAKHLHFSVANSAMIVAGIMMIILEVKRYKTLKYGTDIHSEGALDKYKTKAFRYLGIEMILLFILTLWMMI